MKYKKKKLILMYQQYHPYLCCHGWVSLTICTLRYSACFQMLWKTIGSINLRLGEKHSL